MSIQKQPICSGENYLNCLNQKIYPSLTDKNETSSENFRMVSVVQIERHRHTKPHKNTHITQADANKKYKAQNSKFVTVHSCLDCFFWKTKRGLLQTIASVIVQLALKSETKLCNFSRNFVFLDASWAWRDKKIFNILQTCCQRKMKTHILVLDIFKAAICSKY